jgi:hypothetical protein
MYCLDNNGDCNCGAATACSCSSNNGKCCGKDSISLSSSTNNGAVQIDSDGCAYSPIDIGKIIGIIVGSILGIVIFIVAVSLICCFSLRCCCFEYRRRVIRPVRAPPVLPDSNLGPQPLAGARTSPPSQGMEQDVPPSYDAEAEFGPTRDPEDLKPDASRRNSDSLQKPPRYE